MKSIIFVMTLSVLTWRLSTTADILYFSVEEESQVGTYVGNIVTDAGLNEEYDVNIVPLLKFRFLEQSNGDPIFFSIGQENGIIQVSVVFDRDAICPGLVRCYVTQDAAVVHPEGHLQVISVKIEILDDNDNSPFFEQAVFNLKIPENSNEGAIYNLPLAVDPDSPRNGISQYKLASNSDKFELRETILNGIPRTVQIMLVGRIDREKKDNYQLVLVAFDGGLPPKSGSIDINISVGDANDHGPVFINDTYSITVPEDTQIETIIVTLKAIDLDIGLNGQVSYSFASSTDPQAFPIFGIDGVTGNVYLKEELNFETKSSYHLVILAKDGGVNSQPGYATLIVNVLDSNDNAPKITINTITGESVAKILENSEEGRFVAHISVYDPDDGAGGEFKCSIDDKHFKLNKLKKTRYEVLTAHPFDREERESYILNVECTDMGNPPLSSLKKLSINIQDVNDNVPEFTEEPYIVEFYENNQWSAFITRVSATDRDSGRNAELVYSLQNGQDLLTIDRNTGIIKANTIFDYEFLNEIRFQVGVTDKGDLPLAASCNVIINILDENDQKPIFSQSIYSFTIAENQDAGISVGKVEAIDHDSHPLNFIEFSLMQTTNDFVIDSNSGEIKTNARLNREETSRYILQVIATNAGPKLTQVATATVEISLLDKNDNEPIFDFPNSKNYTLQISNLTPPGSIVGRILAHDLDTGDLNGKLSYFIHEGNFGNMFDLDETSGIITSRVSFQQYQLQLFELLISIEDHGMPMRTAYERLHIQVNSSIIYSHGRSSLVARVTNITIVISVAIVSSAIILILLFVIAILKIRDHRLKCRQNSNLQECPDEFTCPRNNLDNPKVFDYKDMEKDGDKYDKQNNMRYMNHPYNAGNYGNYVTFVSQNEKSKDESYHTDPGYELGNNNVQITMVNSSRCNSPMLFKNVPSHETLIRNCTPPPSYLNVMNCNDTSSIPSRNNETDTDLIDDANSVYSGDLSNTDSGVGPSEEESQGPLFRNSHMNGKNHDNSKTGSKTSLNNDQFQNGRSNPSHKKQNGSLNSNPYVHGKTGSFKPQMQKPFNSNGAPSFTVRYPQNRTEPVRKYNNLYSNVRDLPLHSTHSFDTLPEDDDRSSTSGSYIVDPGELYHDSIKSQTAAVNV